MARRKLALDDEARGNYEAMQPPAAPAPQSGWERDDVLPFARRVENGQRQPGWSLAAPKFLADAVETAGRVGSSPLFGPQRIGQEPREEMVNAAGAVVGPMAGVGIGRAAAMAPKGGGELGIFGGRMARTADHAALARAEKLAAEGAPRERIWDDTGWFKGADNQWRFEIDDSRMPPPLPDPSGGKMRPADVTANGVDGKGAAIRHQALAEAYPQLNDLSVSVGRGSIGGEFSGVGGVGELGVTAPTTGVARGGLLHELQHAVQQQEGFASGGTPGQFQQYKGGSLFKMLRDDAQAFNKYNRLAGEVESRATQKRADLTAEQRRARPPWMDFDVPESQQIVMMGNTEPQQIFAGRAAKTADHAALAKAEQMAASGVPREQIWNDTGWFKGVDGNWRFEIDDSKAKINSDGADFVPAGQIYNHPDLFNAYPRLADIQVHESRGIGYGAYSRPVDGSDPGAIRIDRYGPPPNRVAVHEFQHAVQDAEGFASGGSQLSDSAYQRLAGEVESRAVEKRRLLSPEKRSARPPWLDYDVPEAQQIVRMGNSGPQMSVERPTAAVAALPMDFESRMARAKEMGFDTDNVAFRGLSRPYDGNHKSYYQMFTSSPAEAGEYAMGNPMGAPNVMTALLRKGNNLEVDALGNNFNSIPAHALPDAIRARIRGDYARTDEVAHAAREMGYDSATIKNVIDNATNEKIKHNQLNPQMEAKRAAEIDAILAELGIDDVASVAKDAPPEGYVGVATHERGPVTVDAIFDKRNIRSPNAAFDPARKHEADLMAARFAPMPISPWERER